MNEEMRKLALLVLENEIIPELKSLLVAYLAKCRSGEDVIRYLDGLKKMKESLNDGTFSQDKWNALRLIAGETEKPSLVYGDYQRLRDAIKSLRGQAKWTQGFLAMRCKVSNKSICEAEAGKSDPSLKIRMKVAIGFGLEGEDSERFIGLPL